MHLIQQCDLHMIISFLLRICFVAAIYSVENVVYEYHVFELIQLAKINLGGYLPSTFEKDRNLSYQHKRID